MVDRLRLSRAQIAKIVGNDPEAIKQFETLFSLRENTTSSEQDVSLAADAASATANQAVAELSRVSDALDLVAGAPAPRNDGFVSTDYIDFSQFPPHADRERRMSWNNTDKTLDFGMAYGVTQQIGQETYARVGNTTGVTIPNGTVVGFAGATSEALLVSPYLADGSSPSLYILGVMTHDLPDSGEKGYCTTWGFVRDLNTSTFSAGDILYASPTTPGAFTNVKPTAPNNVIPVAACIVSHATNGVIFVRPTITQMQYYGVFSKTTDQSPSAINTENLLTFDSAQISNGVVIGSPASRIVVPQSGLYQVTATVQITSGSSSAKNLWVWFKKNGTAISNSARLLTVDLNNGYIPITLSETVSLAANGYIEMAFAADDVNVTVDSVAATAFAPSAPAIILSVTQIQQ